MQDWLKKRSYLLLCIILIFVIVPPFIINYLYKIPSKSEIFSSEWSAGEMLSYWGNVLSFLGTVSLSALAIYQNQIIKDESTKREKERDKVNHDLKLPSFSTINTMYFGNKSNLNINLINISNNIAVDVKLYDINIFSKERISSWHSEKEYSYYAIFGNQSMSISLENPEIQENEYISMNLIYSDCFGDEHHCNVVSNGSYNKKLKFIITENSSEQPRTNGNIEMK